MSERTLTGVFADGYFLGFLSGLFVGILLCWLASVIAV